MRAHYAAYDAEEKFGVGYAKVARRPEAEIPELQGVRCGDVVKGLIKPWACPKFGKECSPETPLGALMVSSEGACAAYHLYAGARAKAMAAE
jgi:hydrogenase expression/formation protein HypD